VIQTIRCSADGSRLSATSQASFLWICQRKASLLIYANAAIIRSEHNEKIGEDIEREIPYMKG